MAKLRRDYKKQKQKEVEDALRLQEETREDDFLLRRRSRDFHGINKEQMESIATAMNDISGGVGGDFTNVDT